MDDVTAKRTLVKSPPELWAEISEVETLARHLGEFGEIRITRLEPETTVAWEGDRIRGTVHLEASGWGTKVTLDARLEPDDAAVPEVPEAPVEPAPDAVADAEPDAPPAASAAAEPVRRGFFARLFRRTPVPEPQAAVEAPAPPAPEPVAPPAPEPAPAVAADDEPARDGAWAEGVLVGVLDDLGAAHHRPFSRG